MEKIKEVLEEVEEVEVKRDIQQFMTDMQKISDQVKDRNLVKPYFDYGSLEVTNYILWLCLGELVDLNDKLNEDEE